MDVVSFAKGFLNDNFSTLIATFRISASVFILATLVMWIWRGDDHDRSAKKDEKKAALAKKPLPPGPKGLPFIGYLPFVTKMTPEKIMELKGKYGDIFTFKISGYRYVVLANYELIKEALLMQGVNFSARTQSFTIFNWTVAKSGLLAAEGQMWREHKRFMMTTLRDFGFGKIKLEGRIIDVFQSLIEYLERSKGQPCDLENIVANCATSIICGLMYNQSYDFEDREFWEIRSYLRTMFKTFISIDAMRPRLLIQYLPWFLIPGGRKYAEARGNLLELLSKKVEEHEKTYDENHIRDYMDAHIYKRKMAEAAGDKQLADYFNGNHLITLCALMMLAAIDTTPTTMYWGFYFLSQNPEVQKKIQKELDQVIGTERAPSFNDLPNLPYTEGVVNEILRRTDLVPLNVLHENFEDAEIAGYRIPSRSVIIPSLNAIHRDPAYWTDPEGFSPDHFLNSEGKKVKKESFLPFSMGRRLCPGESLARMEMFFLYTLVMQKFDLKYCEDQKPFPGTFSGLIRLLMPYKVIATPRVSAQ